MDTLEINELAKNSEFRKRIESAIVWAANQISGEDSTSLTEIQAQKRHNKATTVLNGSQVETPKFSYGAAVQSGLNTVIEINEDGSLDYTGGGTLDSDIAYVITTIWDDMSGVSYADLQ